MKVTDCELIDALIESLEYEKTPGVPYQSVAERLPIQKQQVKNRLDTLADKKYNPVVAYYPAQESIYYINGVQND